MRYMETMADGYGYMEEHGWIDEEDDEIMKVIIIRLSGLSRAPCVQLLRAAARGTA